MKKELQPSKGGFDYAGKGGKYEIKEPGIKSLILGGERDFSYQEK